MKAATLIRFRSRPIFPTSPSLRSACANTSLATLTQSNSLLRGRVLVQLISGTNEGSGVGTSPASGASIYLALQPLQSSRFPPENPLRLRIRGATQLRRVVHRVFACTYRRFRLAHVRGHWGTH